MNSTETEGSSDGSDGNTAKVRTTCLAYRHFLATPLHFVSVDLTLIYTYILWTKLKI
jgi:hypothetical protein